MSLQFNEKQIESFWSKVNKTDSCWLWTASKMKSGHGRFRVGDKLELAHRISFFLIHNFLPKADKKEGLMLHKCKNPSCVNPLHLYIGNKKDNAMDRKKDGTQVHLHGQNNGRSILDNETVLKIREDCLSNRVADVARKYNISWSCVFEIKNKLSWKNI